MHSTPDPDAVRPLEKRLAVVTNWGFFAAFGLCFLLSGFREAQWEYGLLGYAALVAGFIGHLIINRVFDTGFTGGEVAFGLVAFALSALGFIGSWLFDPGFGSVNLGMGLAGFGALTTCLLAYLAITYGLRGSYRLIHSLRSR